MLEPERRQSLNEEPRNPLDDPRSKKIIAKTIYRELKSSGLSERDVLAIATELLALVAQDLRSD
jgi:hypothetical protein